MRLREPGNIRLSQAEAHNVNDKAVYNNVILIMGQFETTITDAASAAADILILQKTKSDYPWAWTEVQPILCY